MALSNVFDKTNKKDPDKTVFLSIIKYLNTIEGCKTKIKNLHWSSTNLDQHTKLDEILTIVSDFQDSIAEEAMGMFGKMENNVIIGILCSSRDDLEVLDYLKTVTTSFYNNLPFTIEYAGIRSGIETFIHDLNKYIYILKLCRTNSK